MSLRAVTFDAAGTLVRVSWRPGDFAVDVLASLGIAADPQAAAERYERFVMGRRTEYEAVNARQDLTACRHYWRELTADWMEGLLLPTDRLEAVLDRADRMLYAPESGYFSLFDDALPALMELKHRGLKLAVISNWDYTLEPVLRALGVFELFDVVLASLWEGVEKPDPRLFQVALDRLECAPSEALHVGDDPVDDVQGALGAGLKAVLVDRSSGVEQGIRPSYRVVRSLSELPEAFDWTA